MAGMTQPSDLDQLTLLGNKSESTLNSKLETFPNRHPKRNYTVTLKTSEFTCVCPATSQPDFADLTITYIPDQRIVESKSLKLYLYTYRNQGVFQEHVTNVILDDLVKALDPHWCQVTADFAVRGGIGIIVRADHTQPGFNPPDLKRKQP